MFYFSSTIFQILIYLTNYYFSLILLFVTDLLSLLFQLIFEEITGIDIGGPLGLYEFVFAITGYMVWIIAFLIYNELIIIYNFCGLNEKTTKNISTKGSNKQTINNALDESYIDRDLESENLYNINILSIKLNI